MRHQLRVARMVYGLDANDLVRKGGVVVVDVLDQPQLGLRRTDDQDLLSACQRFDDGMVVGLVFLLVAGTDHTAFVVQVQMRLGRMNHRLFHIIGADMHDMGLAMVKPDDGVEVRHVMFP